MYVCTIVAGLPLERRAIDFRHLLPLSSRLLFYFLSLLSAHFFPASDEAGSEGVSGVFEERRKGGGCFLTISVRILGTGDFRRVSFVLLIGLKLHRSFF